MINGLKIGRKGEFIEKFNQPNAELALIGRGAGTEIMIQKMQAGEYANIEPDLETDLMEFFYVLVGKIGIKDENGIEYVINQNEYISAQFTKQSIIIKALSDVEMIYITSHPVFHYLSKTMSELRLIAEKILIKDLYTHDHGDRVKKFSLNIADRLKLSSEELERIGWAALFHDLGKINVPDEVLSKPGRLTPEEMDYIIKHPVDGAEITKGLSYVDISEIINQHHERMDGTGYPLGIKGDEICIGARIVGVADSFDAMTTDRPYKKGMTVLEAIDEIKALKGLKYDPRVVDAFEKVLNEEMMNE